MTLRLIVGQVIEWLPDEANGGAAPRMDRLVWLAPTGGEVFLVDVSKEGALPRLCPREEVERAITMSQARILANEPFAYLLRPESTYTEAQRKHRDDRYSLIKPITEAPMPDQLRAEVRGALIRKVVEAAIDRPKPLHGKSVYAWLSAYYRRGMVPNALLELPWD